MKRLWFVVLALVLVSACGESQQTFQRDTLIARYKLMIGTRDVNAALDSGIVSGGGAGSGTVKGTGDNDTTFVPLWTSQPDSLSKSKIFQLFNRTWVPDLTISDTVTFYDAAYSRSVNFYPLAGYFNIYGPSSPFAMGFGSDRLYMGTAYGIRFVTPNYFTIEYQVDTTLQINGITGYTYFHERVYIKDTLESTGNGRVIADSIRGGPIVDVETTVGKTPYLVNDTTFGSIKYGGGITQSSDTVRLGTLPLFSCLFDSSNMVTGRKYVLFKSAQQMRITKLSCVGTSTNNMTVDVRWDSDVSAGGTALNSTPFATTSTTTGNDDTAFDNSLIPPNRWVWIILSSTTKPATLVINVEGNLP